MTYNSKLHIGIDISQIMYEGTGVARFTRGLLEQLLITQTPHRYTFFFSGLNLRPDPSLIQAIHKAGHQYIRWYIPPRALAWLWNDRPTRLVRHLLPARFDIWVSSDWTQPPVEIAPYRISIVHDLVYKLFPETVDPLILTTQTRRISRVMSECSLVITDSISTENDVHKYFPNFKEKVVTIYPGVDQFVNSDDPLPSQLRSGEYFLSVGKLEPRKNLPLLMEAFDQWQKKDTARHAHNLAIVGPRGWGDVPRHRNPHILILDHVSDKTLGQLYRNALALVTPSLYEGFGYPLIEAMNSQCPVIASNTSSLAELISDGAGIPVDPTHLPSLVKAMDDVYTDPNLRNRLIHAGIDKAREFTWDTYVSKLNHAIDQLSGCAHE